MKRRTKTQKQQTKEPINDENKIIDGEETDTCWFTVVTILFIISGILAGTFVKGFYYATIKTDSTIPNSELVPFKIKLVNWVLFQTSGFGSWETRRKMRNFLSYFSQISADSVHEIEDKIIPISGENGTRDIGIRIYYPSEEHNLPIMMYYHGGGWCLGSIQTHDILCRKLAKDIGIVVVSVEYSLAPENPFPSAFEDCYQATTWVKEHAPSIRGNPNKIIVAGDSAGGNLAAAVAVEALKKEYRDFNLIYQVLVYPAVDLSNTSTPSMKEYRKGYILDAPRTVAFIQAYSANRTEVLKDHRMSPFYYEGNLQNLPPSLIIVAEFDPLRSDSEKYHKKLIEGGARSKMIKYQTSHGFFSFCSGWSKNEESIQAIQEITKELKVVLS